MSVNSNSLDMCTVPTRYVVYYTVSTSLNAIFKGRDFDYENGTQQSSAMIFITCKLASF
jgi:hypothetical protein